MPKNGQAKVRIGSPPIKVDDATKERWTKDAKKWAAAVKMQDPVKDRHPCFDPDDENQYTIRIRAR